MSGALFTAVRGATAAMGTRFEIVIGTDDENGVRPWLEAALHEFEDLHGLLSRFSESSLLAHINRTAAHTPVRLDAIVFELIETALHVQERSAGAFDIALGTGRVRLDRHDRTVAFDDATVTLDLGGIAKGFALDRAADILREGGIDCALLHGGTSSIITIGAPPDAAAWRIAIAHGPPRNVELKDQALSISRAFSQTVNGHGHIVDPRSRESVPSARCAVVIGPSACQADAWSTALAVLGYRPAGLGDEWLAWIGAEHD